MTTTIAQPTTRTLPETPRSLEVLMQYLRAEVECPRCSAEPGRACKWQRRPGVHLGRFIHAYAAHQITPKELERLAGRLPSSGFGMSTIIRDDCQPRPVKPEPVEAPQLYVVVEVWPDDHWVGVTGPKPKAEAERFACEEAGSFAGRLEVVPATQADLDDADEGDERGVSEYHDEEFALDRGDDADEAS